MCLFKARVVYLNFSKTEFKLILPSFAFQTGQDKNTKMSEIFGRKGKIFLTKPSQIFYCNNAIIGT